MCIPYLVVADAYEGARESQGLMPARPPARQRRLDDGEESLDGRSAVDAVDLVEDDAVGSTHRTSTSTSTSSTTAKTTSTTAAATAVFVMATTTIGTILNHSCGKGVTYCGITREYVMNV